MYRIRTFNKISPVGLNRLDSALYAVSDSETDEDAILVRSAKLLDYDFPKNLLAISRAGAGVNNIPLDRCSEAGIVVFNTPGANANAVKELVLCAMLMGSRDVDGGIQWVRQQVASGHWSPTSHCPWAWMCTATTPSCLWMPPCGWTATSMW